MLLGTLRLHEVDHSQTALFKHRSAVPLSGWALILMHNIKTCFGYIVCMHSYNNVIIERMLLFMTHVASWRAHTYMATIVAKWCSAVSYMMPCASVSGYYFLLVDATCHFATRIKVWLMPKRSCHHAWFIDIRTRRIHYTDTFAAARTIAHVLLQTCRPYKHRQWVAPFRCCGCSDGVSIILYMRCMLRGWSLTHASCHFIVVEHWLDA
jgi:hypothetical protein